MQETSYANSKNNTSNYFKPYEFFNSDLLLDIAKSIAEIMILTVIYYQYCHSKTVVIKINVTAPRMKTNINMALISWTWPHWPLFRVLNTFCSYDKVCIYCSFCLEPSNSSPIHMHNPYFSSKKKKKVTSLTP